MYFINRCIQVRGGALLRQTLLTDYTNTLDEEEEEEETEESNIRQKRGRSLRLHKGGVYNHHLYRLSLSGFGRETREREKAQTKKANKI